MRHNLPFWFFLIGFALLQEVAQAQYIYWTDTFAHRIQRARLDGTGKEDVISVGLTGPRGLALDISTGKVYWSDEGNDWVRRANFRGTNSALLVPGLTNPRGIALDGAGQKLYFVDRGAKRVLRCNFDGSDVEIVVSGLADPFEVALNVPAGHMYVSDGKTSSPTGTGRILRYNLDGENETLLISDDLEEVTALALDLVAGKLYWADYRGNNISRANLDGTGRQTVEYISNPLGLALDVAAGHIYFSITGSGRILRSNLNGSNTIHVLGGLQNPRALALDLSCVGLPPFSPCNDGDPCTDLDVCESGDCLGVPANLPCDDDNICTGSDVCSRGNCRGIPVDGTACNDLSTCTEADSCRGGICDGDYDPGACTALSLVVVAVNGEPCASCPTRHLSPSEVQPGDVITVEVYYNNWDPELDGVPKVIAYEWSLDSSSFTGYSGALSLHQPACESDNDCRPISTPCTCSAATCELENCSFHTGMYVDTGRSDFIFAQLPGAGAFPPQELEPYYHVAAALANGGTADSGVPRYVGTLVLESSLDARGPFQIRLVSDINSTFVWDEQQFPIETQFVPATIEFCVEPAFPTDCNNNLIPDQCERDADSDGVTDDCDPCPADAPDDSDGDGVCNSADACPGEDNSIDQNEDGASDCVQGIPTVSGWGLAVMCLLLLVCAKITQLRKAGA